MEDREIIRNKLNLNKKAETFLTIESAFTDVFVVVLSVTILSILSGISNPENSGGASSILLQGIAGKFSIGIVFGMLGGLIWLKILQSFPTRVGRISSQQDVVHDDILTLTTCLMLYGFSEMSGGNGALAALCFGLVLGNGKEFGFIPYIGNASEDAQLTKSFIFEKWKLMRGLINKENLIEIQYENLINMPKETIDNLKKFTGVSKF